MRTPRVTWAGLLVAGLLASALFAERVFMTLDLGDGSPAIVELLPACVVLLAGVTVIGSRGRSLRPFASRTFLLVWGPWLLLSTLLPFAGVVTGLYPLRGLAAMRTPLVAISAVVLGAEFRLRDRRGLQGWAIPLLIGGIAQGAYALFQQLTVGHLLPAGPWDQLDRWDISVQRAYGAIVLGRSGGFYTNPTILGAWSAMVILFGMVAARGVVRQLIIGVGLAAMVLAQSRGATVALLASLAFALALAAKRGLWPSLRSTLPYIGLGVALFVGWALLAIAGAPVGTLPGRMAQAISVVIGGTDPNLAGRVQFWVSGVSLLRTHPLGTLGPPELLLHSATDSEWVRALLQGSLAMAAALALMLVGGIWLGRRGRPEDRALSLISVFLLVAGLTQIPLEYPPAVLYWALVGMVIVPADLPPPDSVTPASGNQPRRRMLMVATIARTLDTFMGPHVRALQSRGWVVDGMARDIASSPTPATMFTRTWEIGWSRRPIAIGNLLAIRRVREVVREGRYDIVHVQTPIAAFVTRLALRGSWPARPAVVYTAHGFHFHRRAGWLRNFIYGGAEGIAGRWTDDLVVVNAEDRAAAIERRLVVPDRLHWIPGVGIDPAEYDPDLIDDRTVAAIRHDLGIPADASVVLTIAELTRNKNVAYLVAGLARMREDRTHLVIIGDGPEHAAVERAIREAALGHRVHLVARVADVRPYLRAATVFAMVSYREGLPNAMIEAMSMGVPAVGTDTRGIRDLIDNGRGTVVPFDDPAALAETLDRFVSDRGLVTAMAERARTYVVDELGIRRVLDEYRRVYDGALVRRTAAAAESGTR